MLVDTARELLLRSALFGGLPGGVVERLATVAHEADFVVGDVLFRQGDPGDALHLIAAGVVQVSVEGSTGETVVAVLGPGECVGELSLIDGRPRSATVEALEPVHSVVIPRGEFLDALRTNVSAMEMLLVTVVERLRQTDALAADIAQFRSAN